VRNWFGPGLGEIVRVAIDAREGGAFSFVQRRGLDDLDHHGKYLEFIRPERLVFTWAVKGTSDTSQVTVDIAATADGCQVSLTHDLHPHWKDYRERVAASWQKMLSAMATSIQSTP
jgi:uncharacterized protein YndB with AHSA1/START domain